MYDTLTTAQVCLKCLLPITHVWFVKLTGVKMIVWWARTMILLRFVWMKIAYKRAIYFSLSLSFLLTSYTSPYRVRRERINADGYQFLNLNVSFSSRSILFQNKTLERGGYCVSLTNTEERISFPMNFNHWENVCPNISGSLPWLAQLKDVWMI